MGHAGFIDVECRILTRPSANSIAGLVWGFSTKFEIQGDAKTPDDEQWTQLTLTLSSDKNQRVEIVAVSTDPLVFRVSSSNRKWTHAVAFFLAMESHGQFLQHPA